MNPHDPTSLDPEEHALAQRLARLGPHGEPSPALDSRVLAAAHAAVEERHVSQSRRRRWPLGLGVAASLALALGLAWQMRPLPDVAPTYRSEADSALGTAPAMTSPAIEGTAPVSPLPETAAAGNIQRDAAIANAPQSAARSRSAGKTATPAPQPAPPPAPAPAPAAQEPPIVFDAPIPKATQAATQPTPAKASSATSAADATAAVTLPAPTSAPQAFGATRAAVDAGSRPPPSAERAMAPPATSMPSEPARQKIEAPAAAPPAPPAAAIADEDMPIDDIPPATAASPQVRDAWLARIRELAANGKLEDARASLREFQHRYPDYPLPQDLRALLP